MITGEVPPPTPVDRDTYVRHGLPWFDYYDADHADLAASERYVQHYFDTQSSATHTWLATLNEIKTAQLSVRVPDITASLRAVRALQGRTQE